MEINYVDPNTAAENAGNVLPSREKFDYIRDELLHVKGFKKVYFNKQFNRLGGYLMNGDTQPAVVVSLSPLIISAYSDEMDGVLFLKFPDALADMYGLSVGARLVTSTIYIPGNKPVKDVYAGPYYMGNYCDFTPTVQLFMCDGEDSIRNRTSLFGEDVWKRGEEMSFSRFSQKHKTRDGFQLMTKFRLLLLIF